MEVYKFLPKVRGGAQRAEGSVKSLDYVKPFNSVIPLDTAEFIQNNYSNLTDPLRNKVARPPNFGGHSELVSSFKFPIENNKRWKYPKFLPKVRGGAQRAEGSENQTKSPL